MTQQITTIGKKKKTSATCITTKSNQFELKINNISLNLIKDKLMQAKMREIILTVGSNNLYDLSFEIFHAGNTPTSSIYAARQAFARGIVAFYKKYFDEYKAMEIKNRLLNFDKYSLVTDSRRTEPKKFGGPGARARYQKSYR